MVMVWDFMYYTSNDIQIGPLFESVTQRQKIVNYQGAKLPMLWELLMNPRQKQN
jgi:hypothetical protein